MRRLIAFTIVCLSLSPSLTWAEEPRLAKKVLLVGIDGTRLDAIEYSQAKSLKVLLAAGAYTDKCDVLGDRETKADTASGSGWATILTGKFADKHNILGNDFRGNTLADCPSILHRIKKAKPEKTGKALITWVPMHEFIFGENVGSKLVMDGDKKGYKDGDLKTGDAAVACLKDENPDFLFVYFGNTDAAGHGYGFHPKSPKYTNAIEEVDGYLTRVLDAIKARTTYAKEDWLIIICTDHGGQGKGHGGGAKIPEIRNGFLIIAGSAAAKGKIEGKTTNADIVPTALKHLGIAVEPDWKLDRKVVGLK